jgi:transposase
MKLGQVVHEDFQGALARLTSQNIPIKVAYRLKGEIDKLKVEIARHDSLRQELLMKYGKKTPDGKLEMDKLKNVKFDEAKLKLFLAELKELNSIDVEVKSIPVSDLGDKIEISIDDLIMLDGLIT